MIAGAPSIDGDAGPRATTDMKCDVAGASRADSRFRTVLLIDTLDLGGPARVAVTLSVGLRARGVDAWVAHLGAGGRQPPLVDELRDARVPVVDLALRSLLDPRPTLRLARLLRTRGVRLLHTHNRYGHLVGRPAAAAARCPVVSTDHWIHETRTTWRDIVRDKLDVLCAQAFPGHVLMISDAQRRVHERLGRLPATHVDTIPNGVDTRRFRPDADARARVRTELGIANSAPVFVNVAMLREGKGHADLLTAMQLVTRHAPDAILLIVGDGAERARLEAHASTLGLDDSVRFLGMRLDVAAILAAGDAYVHASHFETLPTSILEAMAVGLPVAATDVGGVRELVAHGHTGFLLPMANAPALARTMLQLCDPSVARTLGAAGRRWAESEGSMQRWVDRVAELYGRVGNAT